MPILAQTPAHNIDCETAILGGILQDTTAMGRVVNILSPEHFYVPAYQKIYEVALTLHSKGQPTDYMVVTNYLKTHGELESVGGTQQILLLIDQTISAVNIELHCQIVWEYWWIRKQYELSLELAALSSQSHDYDFVRTETLEKVSQLSQHLALKTGGSSGDRMVRVISAIENLYNRKDKQEESYLLTNIPLLDEKCKIYRPSTLTGILARPKTGKTSFMVSLYCNLLRHYPHQPVLYMSLEMTVDSMVIRYLSEATKIQMLRIDAFFNGEKCLSEKEEKMLTEALPLWNESLSYVDDTSGGEVSITYIQSRIDTIIRETGKTPIVFLDYAQIMSAEGSGFEKAVKIADGLQHLSTKYKTAIIFGLQPNRSCEGLNDKRPQPHHIYGGDIYLHHLSFLLSLFDPHKDDDSSASGNYLEVNCLANRYGESGFRINMSFSPATNTILPLDSSDLMRNY